MTGGHSWTVQALPASVAVMSTRKRGTTTPLRLSWARAATVAMAALGAVVVATPADAACLSQGEARRAVASGEAMRLSEITRAVDGDVVNAELCERRGRVG